MLTATFEANATKSSLKVTTKNTTVIPKLKKPDEVVTRERVTEHRAYVNGYESAILSNKDVKNPYRKNLVIWRGWNRGREQGLKVRAHFSTKKQVAK